MMRAMLSLLVGLLVAQPAAAHWEYAFWGMTPDEVIAASIGAARALPTARQRAATEARMTYRAEAHYETSGLAMEVAFAFDDVTNGLVCVSYAARTAAQSDALREWLIQRFGPPERTVRDPASNEENISWREPDNIDLFLLPFTRPVVLHCARGT
jgi:hypothetical protein